MKVTVKSLDEATIPLRMINYIIGLRMFERPPGQTGNVITCIYVPLIWSLFGICVYFDHYYYINEATKLGDILYLIMTNLPLITIVLLTTLGCYYSKKFNNLKKIIVEVDRSLQKLGSPPKYHELFIKVVTTVFMWAFRTILCYILFFKWRTLQIHKLIALYITCMYGVGTSVGAILLLDFAICVNCLETRFKRANDLLDVYAKDGFQIVINRSDDDKIEKNTVNRRPPFHTRSNNWLQSESIQLRLLSSDYNTSKTNKLMENDERKHLLQVVRLIHLDLYKASKILCTISGTQISWMIRVIMTYFLITLFYVYLACKSKAKLTTNTIEVSIASVVECLSYGIIIALVSRACQNAGMEASRTLKIIHAYFHPTIGTETKDEIRQFSVQIAHCLHELSVYGFFQVNYSLIRMCVSSVTTYLIIMIQMRQGFEINDQTLGYGNLTSNYSDGYFSD